MSTAGIAPMLIDVLDHDEVPTGQSVPVEVFYATDIDRSYGEDADGNRGTLLIERIIIDHYIDPQFIKHLDSWQIERLIKDADAAFDRL